MHNLTNVLTSFTEFTDKEMQHILLHFNPVSLKKGDIILKEGDVCTDMFFVNSGCMMLVTNEKHKGKIIELFSKDFFFIEMVSFMNNEPTNFCIEAATDSELLCISKNDFEDLDNAVKNWRSFRLLLLEKVSQYLATELMSLKIYSNEERYYRLLQERPFLFQVLPQYIIANYLDMTPVGLSKLRGRLSSNHNHHS